MGYKRNRRFLPVAILPAILPIVLLPVMLGAHVPDEVIGVSFGFFIGLSAVALFWMVKRNPRCAPSTTDLGRRLGSRES